jgi:hypothetical protein
LDLEQKIKKYQEAISIDILILNNSFWKRCSISGMINKVLLVKLKIFKNRKKMPKKKRCSSCMSNYIRYGNEFSPWSALDVYCANCEIDISLISNSCFSSSKYKSNYCEN